MNDDAYESLMEALGEKDAQKVAEILAAHPGEIEFEKTRSTDETPLHLAIDKNDAECVRLLLEAGAKAEAPAPEFGKGTPLIHAIECSGHRTNPKIVALLLKHGANPNTFGGTDFFQKRPLLMAAGHGYESIVLMLIEAGADVTQKDGQEQTAVYVAADKGKAGVIRILAEEGADINQRGWIDRSPLEAAIWSNRREAFDTLLELGANPHVPSKSNSTLLMAAACAGETGLLEPLVKMGFRVDDQNANGDTALHVAAWTGRGDCTDKLLALGASKNIENKKGQTPCQIAADEGHIHIVRQLQSDEMKIVTEMKAGLRGGLNVSKPLQLRTGPA